MHDEYFKHSDEISIHFEEERIRPQPTINRLRASVQGQIMFIGDYWLTVQEARALRDWMDLVIPKSTVR